VQPDKLETLDDLLAQAEHYAGFCMRNIGKMSPTLFLIGADGPVMFVPASLVDADEKDAFATTARLVCIAHAATVSVMALEAWMKNLADRFRMSGPCCPTVQHGLCHSPPRPRPVLHRISSRHRMIRPGFIPAVYSANFCFLLCSFSHPNSSRGAHFVALNLPACASAPIA